MPKQILVVEDSPSVLAFLEDMLVSLGYAVETARDGQSALQKVANKNMT